MATPEGERPVCYLDVDDTLLMFTDAICKTHPEGRAAPDAGAFVLWLLEHYEVRWLTAWCPSGSLQPHGAERLAALLNIPAAALAAIRNPRQWGTFKPEGIDPSRPFIWIEDDLPPDEIKWLDDRRLYASYLRTNVSRHPEALRLTWRRLQRHRPHLPPAPPSGIPASTEPTL